MSSLKKNLKGFIRGSANPVKLFTDKKTREATLDPLDLAKEPEVPEPPKVEDIPAPEPMPTADDAEVQKAKKKTFAAARQRSGRLSTILSDSDTLG